MAEQRLPRSVRIRLTEKMAKALYELSVRERRVPPDQATILLRDRLIELGYPVQDEALKAGESA